MPTKPVKEGIKRLTINGGTAITDSVIHDLAVVYKIKSPALVKGTKGIERSHQRYTRALLFIELVYLVSENDSLLRKLKAFYVDHVEYFSRLKKPGTKTFSVDEVFISYATALAFKVTGEGAISKLYRILLHFFAVRHKVLPEPPKNKRAVKTSSTTTQFKPRISLPEDPLKDRRKAVSDDEGPVQVTVDMEAVRRDEINELSRAFEVKKDPLLRSIVSSAFNDHKHELVHYARHEYEASPVGSPRVKVNFRSNQEVNALLENLSFAMLGRKNQSLAMSIIIHFFSQKTIRKPAAAN
jgi:hypothetical protein